MSLNGNLSFVPLGEVLRLLTRSAQRGSLEVTGNAFHGRIFVGERGIDLATVFDDQNLHRHLVNSRVAEESEMRRVTTGETTLAAIAEMNSAVAELLREISVESIYQMSSRGEDFEVFDEVTTPYASPNSFDLEKLLADSAERESEWEKVSEVIPDLSGSIYLTRDLGSRDEVAVRANSWKVLSGVGNGSSTQELAQTLGTTEFWVAREIAHLLDAQLVEIDTRSFEQNGHRPETITEPEYRPTAPVSEDLDWTEPPETPPSQDTQEPRELEIGTHEPQMPEPDPEVGPADSETSEVAAENVANTDFNTSWWQEPELPGSKVEDAEDEPSVVAEDLSRMPTVSEGRQTEVEDDTEAFLEKVFSELDSNDSDGDADSPAESEPQPEPEEGFGLMRRRRMGSLRDAPTDS